MFNVPKGTIGTYEVQKGGNITDEPKVFYARPNYQGPIMKRKIVLYLSLLLFCVSGFVSGYAACGEPTNGQECISVSCCGSSMSCCGCEKNPANDGAMSSTARTVKGDTQQAPIEGVRTADMSTSSVSTVTHKSSKARWIASDRSTPTKRYLLYRVLLI